MKTSDLSLFCSAIFERDYMLILNFLDKVRRGVYMLNVIELFRLINQIPKAIIRKYYFENYSSFHYFGKYYFKYYNDKYYSVDDEFRKLCDFRKIDDNDMYLYFLIMNKSLYYDEKFFVVELKAKLVELGIKFLEISDCRARYVGHSGPKTRKLLLNLKGNIIFIKKNLFIKDSYETRFRCDSFLDEIRQEIKSYISEFPKEQILLY
jgi:hypothetical protein